MLGSLAEADDAVQEAWIRLSRTDISDVDNLRAWLTTIVGLVRLNMLRSRRTRREAPLDTPPETGPAAPALPRISRSLAPARHDRSRGYTGLAHPRIHQPDVQRQ